MPARYAVRKAQREDAEWLLALRLETMAEHFEASGEKLSVDDHLARIERDFDDIRIVTVDGDDVGMVKVVRESGKWRLVQLQILPEHQGSGLGTSIVGDLTAKAREARARLTLSVLKVNPAKRLYDRLGFRVVAEKDASYEMAIDV